MCRVAHSQLRLYWPYSDLPWRLLYKCRVSMAILCDLFFQLKIIYTLAFSNKFWSCFWSHAMSLCINCHNQQNKAKQSKTKQNNFCWVVILSVKKPPPPPHHHHHPGYHYNLSNLRSWFLVCSLILTQLEEIWVTT